MGIYEAAIFSFLQTEIVSDSAMRIFEEFPVLGAILGIVHYMQKRQREDNKETSERVDKMMEAQRVHLKEIYEGNQVFLASLLNQIETKQNKMIDKVEGNTKQLSLNTATVNEIAKVDAMFSELIARLEQK